MSAQTSTPDGPGSGVSGHSSNPPGRKSKNSRKNSKNSKNSKNLSTHFSDTFNGRRRRKRDRIPKNFEEWAEEDKQLFQNANWKMKFYKATQRQCYPIIDNWSFFDRIMRKWKAKPVTEREVAEHKDALEKIALYSKMANLDLNHN